MDVWFGTTSVYSDSNVSGCPVYFQVEYSVGVGAKKAIFLSYLESVNVYKYKLWYPDL